MINNFGMLIDEQINNIPFNKKTEIFDGVLCCLNFCFASLNEYSTKVNQDVVLNYVQKVLKLFNIENRIIPEGLYFFIPMAKLLGVDFKPVVQNIWGTVLAASINNDGDLENLKAGYELLSNLASNDCLTDDQYEYVMNKLIECMRSPNISSEMKPSLFIHLGEMSLKHVHIFSRRINDVLK